MKESGIKLEEKKKKDIKEKKTQNNMQLKIKTQELFSLHLVAAAAKSLQSCSTLCDPVDGSPSGSLVPGILQARTLEWIAISFSNS